MSIDVHPGDVHPGSPSALHDAPATAADEFDRGPPWSETAVTVIAAVVTIGFVSFVAVLMALA